MSIKLLSELNITWQSAIFLSDPVFTWLPSKTSLPGNYPYEPEVCVISIRIKTRSLISCFKRKQASTKPSLAPHLSPTITVFFCLRSRQHFCHYCLCLFILCGLLCALQLRLLLSISHRDHTCQEGQEYLHCLSPAITALF